MREALVEAGLAAAEGEIPVGAVVVLDGAIIGRGHNCKESSADPCPRRVSPFAGRGQPRRVAPSGATLYCIEPCTMCAGRW